MSSYPAPNSKVVGFEYHDDLYLTRSIDAVKGRRGEDAHYVVARNYRCRLTLDLGNGSQCLHWITVPQGFLTDLSTVPRFARWLVSRVGPHLEASIVHDWLYVAWQREDGKALKCRRKFADRAFHAAMGEANVGRGKRWLIYRACRLLGECAFRGRDKCLMRGDCP